MLVQIYGIIQQKQPVASVADSISLSAYNLTFYADGTPEISADVYVTASGSWTTTVIDLGYGEFASAYPSSGSGNGNTTIYCEYNDTMAYRTCKIRFTRGTVYQDIYIQQTNYF